MEDQDHYTKVLVARDELMDAILALSSDQFKAGLERRSTGTEAFSKVQVKVWALCELATSAGQ